MAKENKIIKDLKERNGKLVNQYRDRDIRCVSLERQLEKLQQENQKYKEVFDKVEEYIKKRINSCTMEANSTTNDTMCRITIIGLKHLLDILKEVE